MVNIGKYMEAPFVAIDLKKLPPDEVAQIISDYETAKEVTRPDRLRFIRNKRITVGIDFDMWKDVDAAALLEEGRDPKQYNLCQKYVRGIAGNYILNSYDPKFIDREDDSKDAESTIYKVNRIYYADKEHFNFKESRNQCIFYGVIGGGCEELRIARTIDDPRGRLDFEPLRFDMIAFDPDVLSDRLSRDSKKAWKTFYLSAKEIMDNYPWAEGKVKEVLAGYAETDKNNGEQSRDNTHEIGTFEADVRRLGNRWRVVEYYHIEMEKDDIVVDNQTMMELPETGFDIGSTEDYMAKQVWAAGKGILLFPENLRVIERRKPVLYCTTICPDLGILLENRMDERQLNGHLPFYAWAYGMHDGKFIGIPDICYHAQDDINKREAAKTKVIASSPIANKPYLHPDAVGNNATEIEKFKDTFPDPSQPFIYDKDCPPEFAGKLIGMFQGGQIPAAILQDEAFKIQILDSLCNYNPVLQGVTDRSGESGIHYGRKVMESLVNHRYQLETLIQHEKDKAEDWFIMATKIYGGRNREEKVLNFNRSFHGADGENVSINKFKGTDEQGNDVIENDITSLKRVDVIITQSRENDFQRQAKLETDSTILKSIQPSETNGIVIAATLNDFLRSVTYEDDEQKKKSTEAADLYYELERTRAQAILLQQQLGLQQLQAQAAGMANQPAPPGGAPTQGGAQPVPQIPPEFTNGGPLPGREPAQRSPLENSVLPGPQGPA
ncbi:MAG: hypothetical protein ABIH23_04325 [bacterium]